MQGNPSITENKIGKVVLLLSFAHLRRKTVNNFPRTTFIYFVSSKLLDQTANNNK